MTAPTGLPTLVTIVLTGLMTVGSGAVTGLRADECGPPPPIQVEAVCGQTLNLLGWRDSGPEQDTFAEILSGMMLQLIDSRRRIVAETTGDKDGQFTFRPVSAGSYNLAGEDPRGGFHFYLPVEVTRTRQVCSKRLYVFPTLPGKVCGSYVTMKRPVEIKPPRQWK